MFEYIIEYKRGVMQTLKKCMAFKIESQVVSRNIIRNFLTSCAKGVQLQKGKNKLKSMYFVFRLHIQASSALPLCDITILF